MLPRLTNCIQPRIFPRTFWILSPITHLKAALASGSALKQHHKKHHKHTHQSTHAYSTMAGPSTSIPEFTELLASIHAKNGRVLALCGAGLSAASGLGTFRGAGGLWRKYNAVDLATVGAFLGDAGLVWQFYSYRRHKALQAQPNPAHFALAELARKMPGFLCLSQNVDGLSPRAYHPPDQLKLLHGSLFDIKCINPRCDYLQNDNYDDPIHPLLAVTDESEERLAAKSQSGAQQGSGIDPDELPHCPKCKIGLLRPGVVWFGETLPEGTLSEVGAWIARGEIDLMLVIGTTAVVYPAAQYVTTARMKGARIAVVNMEAKDEELGTAGDLGARDFLFQGDAAKIVPEILKSVIGEERGGS